VNARPVVGRSGCHSADTPAPAGYPRATVHGGRRDAQKAATFGGLLTRWLDHIEARGRAPKTLVENRRMVAAIAEELGAKVLQKLKGSDRDAFFTTA
jgi:hypothetical protein